MTSYSVSILFISRESYFTTNFGVFFSEKNYITTNRVQSAKIWAGPGLGRGLIFIRP